MERSHAVIGRDRLEECVDGGAGGRPRRLALAGPLLYAEHNFGFNVFDLTSPDAPVLLRLDEDVIALHPAGVVLLIGTNDLAGLGRSARADCRGDRGRRRGSG